MDSCNQLYGNKSLVIRAMAVLALCRFVAIVTLATGLYMVQPISSALAQVIFDNLPDDIIEETFDRDSKEVDFQTVETTVRDFNGRDVTGPEFTIPDGVGGTTPITNPHDFPVGVTVVTVTALDSLNNPTSETFEVTILQGAGPVLNPVSIVSDNADTSLAKEGDVITLSFTSDEPLGETPAVTIAGQMASVTNTPNTNEYKAKIDVDSNTPEGIASFVIGGLKDALGNPSEDVSSTSDNSYVEVDTTAPTATVEPLITYDTTPELKGTVDDPAASIVLTVNGEDFDGANNGDGTWSVQVTKQLDDRPAPGFPAPYGIVLRVTDRAGNKSELRRSGVLTIDTVVPALALVSIASDNADTSLATVGDTITLSFTSDETLGVTPVVTIAGQTASVTNPSGNNYEATYTVDASTTSGPVSFSITGLQDAAGNPGADVSAVTDGSSVTVDSAAPTVEILDAPDSIGDISSFAIRVVFSEEVTGFAVTDITVGNGSASNLTTSDNISFAADITPEGSGDVTLDVLAGAAQDLTGNDNIAAEQVVIENKIPEITKQVIANFMLNRANFLLGNQPDIAGLLSGTHGNGGGSLGNLALTGNEFGMELAFATSLSKIDREHQLAIKQRVAEAHQFADSATDETSLMGVYGADIIPSGVEGAAIIPPVQSDANPYGTVPSRRYDLWTEVYGATSTAGDSESSYWVGYLGGHYFVSEDFLIGGLVQLDRSEEEDSVAGSAADGFGWMVGPYMAGNVPDTTLSWDLRAAWGRSNNNVNPIGIYTDEFETERWLLSGKVQGSFNLNELIITPALQGSWFEETQQAYTDSLGNLISAQTISLGELKFGPEFSMNKVLENGMVVSPSVALSGVWNFGINDNESSQGYVLGDEEVRARVDLGIDLRDVKGRSLALSGYYDGLGIEDYEAMGGEVRLSIPFQ